jgi:hypothetical protein
MNTSRRGFILIVVAGMAALLAALTSAFLFRMRADAEDIQVLMREAQARLMLTAGCMYVQESSRLGWDDPGTAAHEEAFGWIDVRDHAVVGPATTAPGYDPTVPRRSRYLSDAPVEDGDGDGSPDRPAWPAIGSVARCPMYVEERPPFAIRLTACYNPIVNDETSPLFGMPYLAKPDPLPVAATSADFALGDLQPRRTSVGLAWFRVYRRDVNRFVVTAGAGATEGFRDWNEVAGLGETARFIDQESFEGMVRDEARLWFLIEWSPAVYNNWAPMLTNENHPDHFLAHPINVSVSTFRSQAKSRNLGGTIRFVQRLSTAPNLW